MQGGELREVDWGSSEYEQLLALRFAELRRPLGLEWTPGELEADRGDRHFGWWREGEWIAVAVVHRLEGNRAKLRQIAVAGSLQGQGLGRHLMNGLEERLAREGLVDFSLHARQVVAGFYRSLGYVPEGGTFEEIGLPHVKMRKVLP